MTEIRLRLTPHRRAVALGIWLWFVSYSLPAAAQSLASGLKDYDYWSLGAGVFVALVGGTVSTAVTLLSRDTTVLFVPTETLRDLVFAAIGGLVMAVVLAGVTSYWTVPVPAQIACLFATGWARMAFFAWTNRKSVELADAAVDAVKAKMGVPGRYPGYQPPFGPGPRFPGSGRFTPKDADDEC